LNLAYNTQIAAGSLI